MTKDKKINKIATFQLSCNGLTVEISSLGATISKWMVPCSNGNDIDIVLGYASTEEALADQNPAYFGCVVGRVANRIAQGSMRISDTDYVLETNNGPNHLHGGRLGFSHRIWEGKYASDSTTKVVLTLCSDDGDQGYPGSLRVTVAYSLVEVDANKVKLEVDFKAVLIDKGVSPVNLAQHTYFNLAGHNHSNGILEHSLRMRNASSYLPVDHSSIPTREVWSVKQHSEMDWAQEKTVRTGLQQLGLALGLSPETCQRHLDSARSTPDSCAVVSTQEGGKQPYGFDHNYVVDKETSDDMVEVAQLTHDRRKLLVHSSVPGVQLYTANYLDGNTPSTNRAKDGARYAQWQGICFETQHFPDSVDVDSEQYPSFAQGACVLLSESNPEYNHLLEYTLEF